ncbi:MAG: hypothetical protein AAGI50_03975 [Pseudomonadota bacterium]
MQELTKSPRDVLTAEVSVNADPGASVPARRRDHLDFPCIVDGSGVLHVQVPPDLPTGSILRIPLKRNAEPPRGPFVASIGDLERMPIAAHLALISEDAQTIEGVAFAIYALYPPGSCRKIAQVYLWLPDCTLAVEWTDDARAVEKSTTTVYDVHPAPRRRSPTAPATT